MVQQCQACKKLNYLNRHLSFHRFPLDNDLRRHWRCLLGVEETQTLPKSDVICSHHFRSTDFDVKPSGIRYLRKGCLPLPFYPNIGHKEAVSSDPILEETASIEYDPDNNEAASTSTSKKRYFIETPSSESDDSDNNINNNNEVPSTSTGKKRVEFVVEKVINTEEDGNQEMVGPLSLRSVKSLTSLHSSSSTSTITASETETQMLSLMHPEMGTVIAPSDFRGKLALVTVPKKRKRRYVGDISSDDFSSPRKAKRHFKAAKETVLKQRKKIQTLQHAVKRLKTKITTLNGLLQLLKDKLYISESSETVLKASLPGTAKEVFERMLKGPKKQKYTPQLRSFALTLCFYSPKAYAFVRKMFNKSLPHPTTISKWYRCVDGSPGFTKESLTALKMKTDDAASREGHVVCNLVFDEMHIRKQVELTGTKFTGYVDLGTNLDSDTLPEAREALVFMLVCLNGSWKIPVGYFLLDGLSGSEKAVLLTRCLEFVHESGVIITSITFDGAAANFTMAKKLGANFDNPLDLQTSFKHPVTGEEVFIFLDPCHMIKLIRNCLGSKKILKFSQTHEINWNYINKLVELQNNEGLLAATKLRLRHLNWTREKMKVRIATQTLSKSVADALLYLSKDLKLPGFENAEATAIFAQLFNDLFDIFNSRCRFTAYSYKRPLSPKTEYQIFEHFDKVKDYINNLSLGGTSVLKSRNKTGFLGFLICMESLKQFYQINVVEKKLLKYVLTYKLSQDHLELFFGAIRSRGGYNNNPSARQFAAAYKRLIVHSEVTAGNTGNALNLGRTPILYCNSGKLTVNDDGEDLQEKQEYVSFQNKLLKDIEEYNYISSPAWNLTDYVEDVVSYIAGFVVRSLKKCLTCSKCVQLMEMDTTVSQLQSRKTYGKLVNASNLVVDVCQAGEKYFRFFDKTTDIFNKKIKNLYDTLITNTMKSLPVAVFNHFEDHVYDNDPVDGHTQECVKLILRKYFKIRIHHETSKKLEKSTEDRVRSVLTKTVLFRGQ